jgi:hypothetical protein
MNPLDIDHMGEIGSRRLAARLRDFWKRRGHEVNVWIERSVLSASDKQPFPIYCVRSDLTAGLPLPKVVVVESTAA